MLPDGAIELIAGLVTTTLLAYGAAIAVAGVQFVIDCRTPRRGEAAASICQYAGTALALLGLVYRHQQIGTVGLLLVVLSVLLADIRRPSFNPRLEAGLAAMALANLLAITGYLAS